MLLWCMGGLVEVEQQEQLQVQLLGHGQGLQWATPWALLHELVLVKEQDLGRRVLEREPMLALAWEKA